jgi:negative regulator of sigma E activity
MTLKRRAAVYLFTVLVLAVYSGPAASAQHTTPKLQNNAGAEKEQPTHLPVYDVVETGATAAKAAALASHLGTSKEIR